MASSAATSAGLTGHGYDLAQFETGRPVPGYRNDAALDAAHQKVTGGLKYFRFPPEPNGYLHIGHAKSCRLNFGEAKYHGGKCYLRYDDTNPESEEDEYIKAIEEMVRWLGWSPDWITFSSDYFDQLHAYAVQLIRDGLAYVDHSTPEMLRKQREERTDSPWRDRTVEENMKLFTHMRQGRYPEGGATLRLKMDMKHDNPNLRDVIAYRVKYNEHPHVGDKWCIYPSYDFTHCLVDSLEHIDYSLCTLEFEIRRESYFWLLDKLNVHRPNVWEFSRLNVTGALLSKRKINALVEAKIVCGFDDPRLLTLAGLRRRGYTPRAINNFCDRVGITRAANVIETSNLENCLREDLDETVPRRMGVVKPAKVILMKFSDEGTTVDAPNHPAKPEWGTRKVSFSGELYIDESDFREVDPGSKFYGLAPGKTLPVGLKYAGNITRVHEFSKDPKTGMFTIVCEYEAERTGKPKTNISWVDAKTALPVEYRLYEPLLTDDKAAIEPDFMKYIDANSKAVVDGFLERAGQDMALRDTCQLERFGYYTVDDDTTPTKRVMNRVISLKEDKAKGF